VTAAASRDGARRGPFELRRHCDELLAALGTFRRAAPETAQRWGAELLRVLSGGGRLLAAGNGGSAAQAQHLTAELVGRYRDDRAPFSALALHADTSSTTAIANDYGVDEVFARQVRAHGRPGDVLMLLSTSGASANLLSAARAARRSGLRVWALTGPAPNPLAAAGDEALCVPGIDAAAGTGGTGNAAGAATAATAATVQELHLVAVHMLCTAFDAALAERESPEARPEMRPLALELPADPDQDRPDRADRPDRTDRPDRPHESELPEGGTAHV
jgi:D-sedoheptulose 7-phosphate isomerase